MFKYQKTRSFSPSVSIHFRVNFQYSCLHCNTLIHSGNYLVFVTGQIAQFDIVPETPRWRNSRVGLLARASCDKLFSRNCVSISGPW